MMRKVFSIALLACVFGLAQSANAGVTIDVIRAVKLAQDRGIAGPLLSISSYAFKHPPVQVPDDLAREWVEEFIAGKRHK